MSEQEKRIAELEQLLREANGLLEVQREKAVMQTEAMLILDWQMRFKQLVPPADVQVRIAEKKKEEA